MSSHHIVRDEQEPALLVLQTELLRVEAIANLLEWSPTILLPLSQLEQLTSLGYKPDVILATTAELKECVAPEIPLFDTLRVEVPDGSDILTSGLSYLMKNGYPAVNILGPPSLLLEGKAIFHDEMEMVFYDENSRWLWLQRGRYRKWLSAGSSIEVYPGEGGAKFCLAGVVATEAEQFLNEPTTFEMMADGFAIVSSHTPFLLKESL